MSRFTKVADLGHAGPINLILKVVSREMAVVVKDQSFKMAEVVAGDETGIVTLRVENEQICHCDAGRTIVVRNAFPLRFDNQLRLEVGACGKVTQSEDANFVPNASVDMSELWL
eukprot:GEMP01102142.1.p1 GENE.GEMP01102142.1~~GEMP01102142.1.p1  ORF type:complete len:134 (-),score=35.21 GEMP01102142.1:382-723(-)